MIRGHQNREEAGPSTMARYMDPRDCRAPMLDNNSETGQSTGGAPVAGGARHPILDIPRLHNAERGTGRQGTVAFSTNIS